MKFSNKLWSKNQVSAFLLAIIMLASLSFAGCAKEEAKDAEKEAPKLEASLSIDCEMAFKSDAAKVEELANSKDGVILSEKEFSLMGDKPTAMDILKESGVSYDDAAGYVSEIGGIKEKDFGEQSGWMFIVNGEMPSVGASEYELAKGDKVEFRYSLDWGADLGFSFE